MSQHEFPFPYNKHAADVLAHVVNFYLQYQIRQFVKTTMSDLLLHEFIISLILKSNFLKNLANIYFI